MDYRDFKGLREPAKAGSRITDPAVWRVEDVLNSDEWIYEFKTSEILEIGKVIRKFERSDLDFTTLKKSDFYLPQLSLVLSEVREELLYGRGFCSFSRLPCRKIW